MSQLASIILVVIFVIALLTCMVLSIGWAGAVAVVGIVFGVAAYATTVTWLWHR